MHIKTQEDVTPKVLEALQKTYCGSVGAEFMHKMTNDYLAEMSRLSSLGMTVTQGTGLKG